MKKEIWPFPMLIAKNIFINPEKDNLFFIDWGRS